MFNSAVLDVAIGMTFLYVLLSLLCTSVNETISQWLDLRAVNLEKGIKHLLKSGQGAKMAEEIMRHPLVKGLSKEGSRPSYIPSQRFVLALLDIASSPAPETSTNQGKTELPQGLAPDGAIPTSKEGVLLALKNAQSANILSGDSVRSLTLLLNDVQTDVNDAKKEMFEVQKKLEGWFDESMDRVAGWYKKTSHNIILGIAIVVCVTLNIDSIQIAESLWKDTALRSAIVAAAGNALDNPNAIPGVNGKASPDNGMREIHSAVETLNLPIGWDTEMPDYKEFSLLSEKFGKYPLKAEERWGIVLDFLLLLLLKVLGITTSASAAALGAPFWFDLLGKLMKIRSTGQRLKTASEQAAEQLQQSSR